ncbi:sugar ABC transporter permease [Chitinivorax sp. B]|uniref:carbohydrate ABC transporter permease n=1 Tax=Chitinivorax sp. B TaxID=2502235 RepID=UPI0014850FC3|nr:sugar ABC transporter permease [Chitinivorax sp. B]
MTISSSTAVNFDPPVATMPRHRKLKLWDWAPYVFISPFFILFLIFGAFPLGFSIYLSFHQWDPAMGLEAMKWVGLENYIFVLGDDWFRQSLWNTIWIAIVSGAPQHLIAIPLAFFLNIAFGHWRNTVVGMYFLPFITSTVAIALVFNSLFSREFGVVNQLLTHLGHLPILEWVFPSTNIDWTKPEYVRWQIAFVVWWRYLGWNTVLYLAALQTIPRDLYEAALVDGATRWQQFWHVTVPLLKPMMFFAITLTLIGNLQLFEEPFILTGGTGGIGQVGKTAAMHMYNTAFVESDFGTASAVAWLLFLFIAVLTWLNNKLFNHSGLKDH